jgi:hypothetical protein
MGEIYKLKPLLVARERSPGADSYYQPRNIDKQGGVSLKIDHDFGFARLESITAFLQSSLFSAFDGTLEVNPAYALNIEVTDLHTQFQHRMVS